MRLLLRLLYIQLADVSKLVLVVYYVFVDRGKKNFFPEK